MNVPLCSHGVRFISYQHGLPDLRLTTDKLLPGKQ
jgi:hypothetical protein